MKRVLIIDTSILCVWLKVPGKETTGRSHEYTYDVVAEYIEDEKNKGTHLVLPIATIIETGNHIAHTKGNKEKAANELSEMILTAAKGESPWVAIHGQNALWQVENLLVLVEEWKKSVITENQSIGDAAIVQVARHFASASLDVEIFTGDGGLKNYQYKIQGKEKRQLRRNRK